MTIKEIRTEIIKYVATAYMNMDEADLQDMFDMLAGAVADVKDEMDRVDRILTE